MAEGVAELVEKEEGKSGNRRRLAGPLGWAVHTLAFGTIIFTIVYQLRIFQRFGIFIYPVGYRGAVCGLIMALLFLLIPIGAKKKSDALPWYDGLFAVLSLITCGYPLFYYRYVLMHAGIATPLEQVFGVICIVLIMESVRRTMGFGIMIITCVFLFYPSMSVFLPGLLHGSGYELDRLIGYMYLYEDGVFGSVLKVVTDIVIPFILFGQFLDTLGAGKFFVNFAYSIMGSFRGGPAKIAILATGLLGTITGSAAGNVATTGVVTIPLMKKVGYPGTFAAGVEAVGANGGSLMPPVMGATAFIMAEFTEIPYSQICVAGALPAILYYLALYFQVDMKATNMGLHGVPRSQLPSFWGTLAKGWHYILPIIVLIYVLIGLRYEPVMAAYSSLALLMIVSLFQKEGRITPAKFVRACEQTSRSLLGQIGVMAASGIIVGAVGLTGLGVRLSQLMVQISAGDILTLLIMTAIVNYLLGTGLPGSASYILLAVLVAPGLEAIGIPKLAAHFFIFYTAMWSHITPPVAPAAFIAATIADCDPYKAGWMACRLGIVGYFVPFVFAYNQAIFLQGPLATVILTVVICIAAVYVLSGALEGFCFEQAANIGQRVLLAISGIALLWGGCGFQIIANIVGVVASGIVVAWMLMRPAGRPSYG